MADLSDVEQALVTLIAQTMYPNGTAQPSVANVPCVVYAGWPTASRLDDDLVAGKVHITVFPRPEERNTTRYSTEWQQLSLNTATITLTISGQTITVGGAMPAPFTAHNVMAMVNGKPYVYAVQAIDTLTSIATALAALINADVTASSAGAVITIPAPARISAARVGITGTAIREIRRQERTFQITIWADTPAHRDAVSQPIDVALTVAQFLTMPDTTGARLIYKGSPVSDAQEKANLYRRDLLYSVEYATTQTEVETQVTQIVENVSSAVVGAKAYDATKTIYQ